MEPNKFDKYIKKQLEDREISPSSNAWDKLSEKLDVASPQKRKKGFIWYGVAASIIGLLIVSLLYFNQSSSLEIQNVQVVESPVKTNVQEIENVGFPITNTENEKLVFDDTVTEAVQKETVIAKSLQKKRNGTHAIAMSKVEQEDSLDTAIVLSLKTPLNTEELLNAKILEVVAQVNSLENANIDLSNAEVDSLLRRAQKELVANNTMQNGVKIDPMALLTDVEDQLDQSFRDKLFERLKTGFVKVRTAVADRNN